MAPRAEAIVIAASTGGPTALQIVLSGLPAGFRAAVLVVQHIPRGFTRSLAERLDARSAIPVREARDGDPVEPGHVLIAPAGIHSRLRRRGGTTRVVLDEEPRDALHRPSADVLMASAAGVYGRARRRGRAHRHGLGRHRGPARDPRRRRASPWPRARRPA